MVAIGFGGNLGRPDQAFRDALRDLDETPGLSLSAVSRLWRSEPWGDAEQPAFLNAAARFDTFLEPRAVLRLLQDLEQEAGARSDRRWGPRHLDLDLLVWGAETREEDGLVIPHPHLEERTFVLEPLAEVAPEWRHPRTGLDCRTLLEQLRASGRATGCEVVPGSVLGRTVEVEAPACLR